GELAEAQILQRNNQTVFELQNVDVRVPPRHLREMCAFAPDLLRRRAHAHGLAFDMLVEGEFRTEGDANLGVGIICGGEAAVVNELSRYKSVPKPRRARKSIGLTVVAHRDTLLGLKSAKGDFFVGGNIVGR